jgi:hypothetical protein
MFRKCDERRCGSLRSVVLLRQVGCTRRQLKIGWTKHRTVAA